MVNHMREPMVRMLQFCSSARWQQDGIKGRQRTAYKLRTLHFKCDKCGRRRSVSACIVGQIAAKLAIMDTAWQRISRNVHSRNRLVVVTVKRQSDDRWPLIWSGVAVTRCARCAQSDTGLMISAISHSQRFRDCALHGFGKRVCSRVDNME